MNNYLIILAGVILVGWILPAVLPAEEAQYPAPSGFVNDFAGLISPEIDLSLDKTGFFQGIQMLRKCGTGDGQVVNNLTTVTTGIIGQEFHDV